MLNVNGMETGHPATIESILPFSLEFVPCMDMSRDTQHSKYTAPAIGVVSGLVNKMSKHRNNSGMGKLQNADAGLTFDTQLSTLISEGKQPCLKSQPVPLPR